MNLLMKEVLKKLTELNGSLPFLCHVCSGKLQSIARHEESSKTLDLRLTHSYKLFCVQMLKKRHLSLQGIKDAVRMQAGWLLQTKLLG